MKLSTACKWIEDFCEGEDFEINYWYIDYVHSGGSNPFGPGANAMSTFPALIAEVEDFKSMERLYLTIFCNRYKLTKRHPMSPEFDYSEEFMGAEKIEIDK